MAVEETKTLTLRLPESVHRKLRALVLEASQQSGDFISCNAYVTSLIEMQHNRRKPKAPRRRRTA